MQAPEAISLGSTRRSTLIAALVALCAAQAHAASGVDALCDRSEERPGLSLGVDELSIDLVEHIAADGNAVVKPDIQLVSPPPMPLTELKAPGPSKKSAGMADVNESEVMTTDDDLPGPHSRFPGVSDRDALRYRRQMYRTDI